MKCTDSSPANPRILRPLNPPLAAAVQRYRERRGIPTGPVLPLPDATGPVPSGLRVLLTLSRPAHERAGVR
jgi:hypothetical protein